MIGTFIEGGNFYQSKWPWIITLKMSRINMHTILNKSTKSYDLIISVSHIMCSASVLEPNYIPRLASTRGLPNNNTKVSSRLWRGGMSCPEKSRRHSSLPDISAAL